MAEMILADGWTRHVPARARAEEEALLLDQDDESRRGKPAT